MQQRQSRRLVDASALGLDDAVLDLVAHAEAVAAADLVGAQHQLDVVEVARPSIATGQPPSKLIVTSSVAMSTAGSQWATPMIGETISIVVDSSSSDFASCVAPQMLASVEYAFSLGSR